MSFTNTKQNQKTERSDQIYKIHVYLHHWYVQTWTQIWLGVLNITEIRKHKIYEQFGKI
jgi:hypothetical protein